MNLRKLLKPRTIAIVGASEKAGFGGDTTRNYLKFSRNLDKLYLVNPGRDTSSLSLPLGDRGGRGSGHPVYASKNNHSFVGGGCR